MTVHTKDGNRLITCFVAVTELSKFFQTRQRTFDKCTANARFSTDKTLASQKKKKGTSTTANEHLFMSSRVTYPPHPTKAEGPLVGRPLGRPGDGSLAFTGPRGPWPQGTSDEDPDVEGRNYEADDKRGGETGTPSTYVPKRVKEDGVYDIACVSSADSPDVPRLTS